jgi:hypothetical protein
MSENRTQKGKNSCSGRNDEMAGEKIRLIDVKKRERRRETKTKEMRLGRVLY